MKKVSLISTLCLLAAAFTAQATEESWVNNTRLQNPVIDARNVTNNGNISFTGGIGNIGYQFNNVENFYNSYDGYISVDGPIFFNHSDYRGYETPMFSYTNEGMIVGGPIQISADRVVDSGIVEMDGSKGLEVTGKYIDLWGVQYTVTGGRSPSLNGSGLVNGSNVRPAGIYPLGWGYGVNGVEHAYFTGAPDGPVGSIYSVARGFSVEVLTPVGGPSSLEGGPRAGDWWNDGAYKAYIRQTAYDANTNEPKPFYQIVFVPGDSISLVYEDPMDPTSHVKDCTAYNQFRVDFIGSPYDNPFAPYAPQYTHGGAAVHITQYLYKSTDAQLGKRYPRYEQFHWEDTSGYDFLNIQSAGNTYVKDTDGRGYIPDHFRVDHTMSAVSFSNFVYAPWREAPIGELALPPRYVYNPTNGNPLVLESGSYLPSPAWIQEQMLPEEILSQIPPQQLRGPGRNGPYYLDVANSCVSGSSRGMFYDGESHRIYPDITDPNNLVQVMLTWLHGGRSPYGVDFTQSGSDQIATTRYSAYAGTVGYNYYDKNQLISLGIAPSEMDPDSRVYPGHITINGGEDGNILDNAVFMAESSVNLNLTNLVGIDNVTLCAPYVNAFFSKVKGPNNEPLVLKDIVRPMVSRVYGDFVLYSAIYNIDMGICQDAFERYATAPEPTPEAESAAEGDDEGEIGDEGEGEEETEEEAAEWDDKSFLVHLVFLVNTVDLANVPSKIDYYSVDTECDVEIDDVINLSEDATISTPNLTLDGSISFPKTVDKNTFKTTITNFVNNASLTSQLTPSGGSSLSGYVTNQLPQVDFILGTDRVADGENQLYSIANHGIIEFSRIDMTAKNLEYSEGGQSVSYIGTTLTADQLDLANAELIAGSSISLNATDLTIRESILSAADSYTARGVKAGWGGTTNGLMTLNVTGKLDDGGNGAMIDEVKYNFEPNEWTVSGAFRMSAKPASGDLLNTSLTISNPRVSRNVWAGENRGDTEEGWKNNVALGALLLDGALAGNAALRFDFTGLNPDSALYVRDLYLGVGDSYDEDIDIDYDKMFRFEDLTLYYVNCYVLKKLPAAPGTSADEDAEPVWVLVDRFPGTSLAKAGKVVQTKNHPNWTKPVGPMSIDMDLIIRESDTGVTAAAIGSVKGLELVWTGEADAEYTILCCDTLNGEWYEYATKKVTTSGEQKLSLQPSDKQRYFYIRKN